MQLRHIRTWSAGDDDDMELDSSYYDSLHKSNNISDSKNSLCLFVFRYKLRALFIIVGFFFILRFTLLDSYIFESISHPILYMYWKFKYNEAAFGVSSTVFLESPALGAVNYRPEANRGGTLINAYRIISKTNFYSIPKGPQTVFILIAPMCYTAYHGYPGRCVYNKFYAISNDDVSTSRTWPCHFEPYPTGFDEMERTGEALIIRCQGSHTNATLINDRNFSIPNIITKASQKHRLAIGIATVYGFNGRSGPMWMWLIEYLEWSKTTLQNIEFHITVYVAEVNVLAHAILQYYQAKNPNIQVVDWSFIAGTYFDRIKSQNTIIADCLFRYYDSDYFMSLDIDEFIQLQTSWSDLLSSFDSFPNTLGWILTNNDYDVPRDLRQTQRNFHGTPGSLNHRVYHHEPRPKYIARPQLIQFPTIHYPIKLPLNDVYPVVTLSKHVAVIYHYFSLRNSPKQFNPVDPTMSIFNNSRNSRKITNDSSGYMQYPDYARNVCLVWLDLRLTFSGITSPTNNCNDV